MTAEIAILNRSALALAADSAVTISVGSKTKVYDTAEKLFEFSRLQPIALMIYNNVEFVGVPLEVLIRKYRCESEERGRLYETMQEAADDFLKYLTDFDHDIDEEKRYLFLILRDQFGSIFKDFVKNVRTIVSSDGKSEFKPTDSPESLLIALVKERSSIEAGRPLDGFMTGVTLTKFRRRYSDVIERACKMIFKGIDASPAILREASRLAFNIVKSQEGSDLLTGLVFGGFAKKDMFPTLRYMEIDGTYFGEIKILSCDAVDIDRKGTRAEVVPFAQKEMVERFVYGLDSEVDDAIRSFVTSAVSEIIDTVGPELKADAKSSIRRKVNTRFRKMMGELRDRSRQDLMDIVYFMSKKELADIAYALVELTSHKRRFSTDEDSVGGPIDVAILTKSEGLVWIKRKHYFAPEINESYFSRVFGRSHRSHGGSHERKAASDEA